MQIEDRLYYSKKEEPAAAALDLLEKQIAEWEQCTKGYATLDSVETKEFHFDNLTIKVQFNPGRLTSSSAKVDPKSISERKCFLCIENLPGDQKGLLFNDKYIILCNPFPIFPEHFTIPAVEHKPQRILPHFDDFLHLTRNLSGRYITFYNGPKCGASAPDHFHFQAGNKSFLPLIEEYEEIKGKFGKVIYTNDRVEIFQVDDHLRRMIFLEGNSPQDLENSFRGIYSEMEKISIPGEEPLMNIISDYQGGLWKVIIILREKHRPSRFFEEGERNILLSPASVDIGGVCITPLEKDFKKISNDDLVEIFNEVILKKEKFSALTRNIGRVL